MNKQKELIKQEEKNTNVVDLEEWKGRLATDGFIPPDDPNDWLMKLPTGAVFLVQDRTSNDFHTPMFKIVDKTAKSVFLVTTAAQQPMSLPVNPIRFCRKYSLHELLGIISTVEEKEEEQELYEGLEKEALEETKEIT